MRNVLVRSQHDYVAGQHELGAHVSRLAVLDAEAARRPVDPGRADERLALSQRILERQEAVAGLSAMLETIRAELARVEADGKTLSTVVARAISASVVAPVGRRPERATTGAGPLFRPVPGAMGSPFGDRFDPVYHRYQLHEGVDIAADLGEVILAAAPGRVTHAGWLGGYGNYTCLSHGQVQGQELTTCYAHQSAIGVHIGDIVAEGYEIGRIGSTGASTGPHLHFEVRLDGRAVDPLPWLGK